jgi:Mg2+-importing ATPase
MRFIVRFVIHSGVVSSLFDFLTFGVLLGLFATSVELFRTGWFVESLATQTLIVHIIRTNKIPFLQSSASLALTLTTLTVMGAAVYLPFSPLAGPLGFVALPPSFWAWLAATVLCYAGATQLMKSLFLRRYGAD